MFRTYRDASIPLASRLEPDLQLWTCIEQIVHLPWYYITVARYTTDGVFREMLMIADVLTLEHLCLSGKLAGTLEQVLLVSPASMNGQGRWVMDPLLEIAYVADAGDVRRHYTYRLQDGKTYLNECDPGLEAEHGNTSRQVLAMPGS